MPVSVFKKASANVSTYQHIKNGLHLRDIFGNEDGGPPFTFGIATITKHDSGETAHKLPYNLYIIVTEGEIFMGDDAKPGDILVLKPGDVARVDKGTILTCFSPTSGKAYYVGQHEFGSDQKEHLV